MSWPWRLSFEYAAAVYIFPVYSSIGVLPLILQMECRPWYPCFGSFLISTGRLWKREWWLRQRFGSHSEQKEIDSRSVRRSVSPIIQFWQVSAVHWKVFTVGRRHWHLDGMLTVNI